MPELRTRSIQEAGAMPIVRQGFWIRTAASAAAAPQQKQARRVTAASNKENITRPWAGTGRRRVNWRRSPLPEWYPRTPLGDITNIVQALERRTMQIRRDAWAQPLNHETETSPEREVLEDSPLLVEPYTPPVDVLPDDIFDTFTITDTTLSSVSPNQHSGDTLSSATYSSSEQTSELELSTSLSPKDLQTTEYEKKLGNSIDEIEKAILGNLKRPTKVAAKNITRALMSMR